MNTSPRQVAVLLLSSRPWMVSSGKTKKCSFNKTCQSKCMHAQVIANVAVFPRCTPLGLLSTSYIWCARTRTHTHTHTHNHACTHTHIDIYVHWEAGWGARDAGWKYEWRVTSQSCYNIIFILHQPGNSAGSPQLSQYQTHGCPGSSSQQPTSVGTLGERGHMQFSSMLLYIHWNHKAY